MKPWDISLGIGLTVANGRKNSSQVPYIKALIYLLITAFFTINWLNISGTYCHFSEMNRSDSLRLQAGVWSIGEVDVEAWVTDPNPSAGKQFNIKANNPVRIEIRSVKGFAIEDIVPELVTLEYMGDQIEVGQYRIQQDILVLTFTDVASILIDKLPGGHSQISLTLRGHLVGGYDFSTTCPLLVHVPPGSINMEDSVPFVTEDEQPELYDVLSEQEPDYADDRQIPVQEDDGDSIGKPETNPEQGHQEQDIDSGEPKKEFSGEDEGQDVVEVDSENPQQQSDPIQETENESVNSTVPQINKEIAPDGDEEKSDNGIAVDQAEEVEDKLTSTGSYEELEDQADVESESAPETNKD